MPLQLGLGVSDRVAQYEEQLRQEIISQVVFVTEKPFRNSLAFLEIPALLFYTILRLSDKSPAKKILFILSLPLNTMLHQIKVVKDHSS